ncbi:MAG: alanine dehydrogenase [Oscillospiraceae bacterium]
MIIGIPKEIKNNENRVAITPAGVHTLAKLGHTVLIETAAGLGSGITDEAYKSAGAALCATAGEVYGASELIVKVKEPLEEEFDLIKEGQAIFTYLHLAADPALTQALLKKKATAVGYETVQLADGSLPLLSPMSEVAGRMSVQIGASLLQSYKGGEGLLLGGVPGVRPGEVLIIGGGVAGTNAAKVAAGMGARVTVMDINKRRLDYLDDIFMGRISTVVFNEYMAAELLGTADLLVSSVLVRGARAPKIVSAEMVKLMKKGSVIVDIAIDQGGSVETVDRVTTHDNPCFEKFGVIHYSVANIPGAVPKTSTWALTSVTLPYVIAFAQSGIDKALTENEALLAGLNTYNGAITMKAVAESMKCEYIPAEKCLAAL